MPLLARPFVFARHGETTLNRSNCFCGRLDAPLTEEGERQARALQAVLGGTHWSCVAVSTLQRARRTAELAVPGQGLLAIADLGERDWGAWEGQPLSPVRYTETPPDGEPWAVFSDRVLAALNAVLEHHANPLVIAHSGVFRVIQAATGGHPQGPRLGNAHPLRVVPPEEEDGPWSLRPFSAEESRHGA